jgi:hypothetical protein
MKTLACVGVLLCVVSPVFAQPAVSPQQFQVRRSDAPIRVDGTLDEPAWQHAIVIPLKYEWFPGNNTAATVETTCRITFDDTHFYVAFTAKDPQPGSIRANLADRDAPFLDDTVGFMVDTFNDGRRAFQFRVNARGVQMDAFNSDVEGSEDWSWDAIWDAKTRVDDQGYTVEIAVPFSSLRFQRTGAVQTWGFMASRDMPRSSRLRMRSTITDRDRACLVCQFDKLTGLEGINPGRNIELDPTVTAARTDTRQPFPGGDFRRGDADYAAGLSARWSVTPNVVVSGTLNPDFYQVEADSAQLDVNTRFQLFFPEKRPFFLEGADFFATPIEAVFTRTVADPRWGLKVTGKEGPHAFGIAAAQDAVTGISLPGYESSDFVSRDKRYLSNVFRYRRDVGTNGSTIGALYAGREGDAYANRVGGLDANLRLSAADTVRMQWLGSHTEYPDDVAAEAGAGADPIRGSAFTVNYSHGARIWNWRAAVGGISPEFRADSGYMPQVGLRRYSGAIGRNFSGGANRWFNQIYIGVGADRTEDWKGERASWGCDFPIEYSGRWQMTFSYNPACNKEYYLGNTYNNWRHNVSWSIRPSGQFSLNARATLGGAVDFVNAQKADQTVFSGGGTFNIFGRLSGDVSHTYQALNVAAGRLYTANLTQGRLVFHLNIRTYVRAIFQYTDIDRTNGLIGVVTQPDVRRLFTQWLFNYKLNPQTVLLVGYSDNSQGGQSLQLTRANRTFFLKIGYAWTM